MKEDAFTQFFDSHRKELLRISRATRGEASLEDVQAEAWLMVAELRTKGIEIDLEQAEHRQLLIARLYQHLVRYAELNVRYAVRLDHAPSGEEGAAHPLAYLLAADECSDPAVALMHAQEHEKSSNHAVLNPHQSLASAYLRLLDHLGHRMAAVADHLRISLSYCYQRCAHTRSLAVQQQPLPAAALIHDPSFIPGAWRSFRLQRRPVQLSFDFEWSEALFAEPC